MHLCEMARMELASGQGRLAFRRGESLLSNPLPDGSERQAWFQGWLQAEKEKAYEDARRTGS